MTLRDDARKFIRVLGATTRRERGFTLRAFAVAPFAAAATRLMGLRRTLDWVERVPMGARPDGVDVRAGARLVGWGFRAHPWLPGSDEGQCLPRALVQHALHRRDGTPSRFVVGVRSDAPGQRQAFAAHAWVEGPDDAQARRHAPIFRSGAAA